MLGALHRRSSDRKINSFKIETFAKFIRWKQLLVIFRLQQSFLLNQKFLTITKKCKQVLSSVSIKEITFNKH